MKTPVNNVLMIVFGALGVIFIVATILTPILVKNSIIDSTRDKTKLKTDNPEIWGEFPGKLGATIKHTFSFFDYSNVEDENSTLQLNKTIAFKESIKYHDLKQTQDQISFKATRKYELLTKNEDDKVKLPSIGLYEYLHTVSNPSSYKVGISGLFYLDQFAESYQNNFDKQVFIKNNSETFLKGEENITTQFFSGVAPEKRHHVYSNSHYGFDTLEKIFIWVKLVGNPSKIEAADWLKTVLELTDKEIQSAVGETSELSKFYDQFKEKIEEDFGCKFDECNLAYRQLSDNSVSDRYGFGGIKELLSLFHPKQMKFAAPEMKAYFDELPEPKPDFNEIKLTGDQLKKLFPFLANDTLYNPDNMIILLGDYSKGVVSQDLKTKYDIKSKEQLTFLCDYIIKYLPKTYFFMEFEHENEKYTISGKAKAYNNLIRNYVSTYFNKLYSQRDKIYGMVLKRMIDSLWKDEDREALCPEMLQRIIGDGKRVLKICNDEYFSLSLDESLTRWTTVYSCFRTDADGKSDCDETLLKEFMTKGVLSRKEMEGIFSEDSIGFYFDLVNKEISESYGCQSLKCSGEELATAQYATSKVTLHPPERITETGYSLHDWDPKLFPEANELTYIQKQYNFTDTDCSDKIKEAIVSFAVTDGNYFSIKYKDGEGYSNKMKLDMITTLFYNGITDSKYSQDFEMKDMTNFYKFFSQLIEENLMNVPALTEYKLLNVLLGNSEEDKVFLDLLSNGDVYEFYKPGLLKTTGFNIKYNPANENETYEEEYSFYTDNKDKTNNVLRKITKMNSKSFLNFKKLDFSPADANFREIDAPLYKYARLDENNKWLSDGYEYPMQDEIDNIFYFDELSTRKFQYDFKESTTYEDIDCRKYLLNPNLIQGLEEEGAVSTKDFPTAYQTFNKPMIVTTGDKEFYYDIQRTSNENYFCVDEITNMVLESKINLVYGINTEGFKIFHSGVTEGVLPIIKYSREYHIDKSEYEKVFDSFVGLTTTKIWIIVVGIILILLALGAAAFFFLRFRKEAKSESEEETLVNKKDDDMPIIDS